MNTQCIRNSYSQICEFIRVPRHFKHMVANGAALFHLAVKELLGGFIDFHDRVSLKYHFEIIDNIMRVVVLKELLKYRFQTVQDDTLNCGVLILSSEVKKSYPISSIICRRVT